MFRSLTLLALVVAALPLAGCKPAAEDKRPPSARAFPQAYRPVSARSGDGFSNEQVRDDRREAATVMDLAAIRPGMAFDSAFTTTSVRRAWVSQPATTGKGCTQFTTVPSGATSRT